MFGLHFDSLPHSLILGSLARVGVAGSLHAWFRDYLSCRRQCVALWGITSVQVKISSGMPQGSILGLLLFIIALDPLLQVSISKDASIGGFADDVNYYKPSL